MVHPCTGYQLIRSLAWAPRVAEALAHGLRERPDPALRRAWRALWTPRLRLMRQLDRYGLEVLLRLDGKRLQRFWSGLFELPDDQWRAWTDAEPRFTARFATSWRMFTADPARLPFLIPLGDIPTPEVHPAPPDATTSPC